MVALLILNTIYYVLVFTLKNDEPLSHQWYFDQKFSISILPMLFVLPFLMFKNIGSFKLHEMCVCVCACTHECILTMRFKFCSIRYTICLYYQCLLIALLLLAQMISIITITLLTHCDQNSVLMKMDGTYLASIKDLMFRVPCGYILKIILWVSYSTCCIYITLNLLKNYAEFKVLLCYCIQILLHVYCLQHLLIF